MTTIAYRDGIMASDSLVTQGGVTKAPGSYAKIQRLANGTLYGAAGCVSDCSRFLLWLTTENDDDQPPKGDYSAILVSAQGKVMEIECGNIMPRPRGTKFIAIGSGAPYANAAMYAGATAPEAVKIAVKIDPMSGLPVRSLKLK